MRVSHVVRRARSVTAHGEWLPWLKANAEVLGFNTDRTARMLMRAAKRKLASDFDAAEAVEISRLIWGLGQ
jgi:hypothetical protein